MLASPSLGSIVDPRRFLQAKPVTHAPFTACRRQRAWLGKARPVVAASMATLVTFDVDGTLITNDGLHSNRLHKQCFNYAWKKVFDIDLDIEKIRHTGMTDPLILLKVLELEGVPKEKAQEKLKEMEAAMLEYWQQNKGQAADGLLLLPGVVPLLQALQERPQVKTGLVTGNLQQIGWDKMEALGIISHFSDPRIGGFGSDFCSGNTVDTWRDRAELIRIAASLCKDKHGEASRKFHIGDTPMDVMAAAEAGAIPIGVLTGTHSRQELEATGIENMVILENLADVERVLKVLGVVPT
eukprot:jgi/Botrbrau1/17115/Bobra.0157s0017.1